MEKLKEGLQKLIFLLCKIAAAWKYMNIYILFKSILLYSGRLLKGALSGGYKFIKPSRRKSIWPPAAQNSHAKDMYHQKEQCCKGAENMNKNDKNHKISQNWSIFPSY